jgi:hypothetical protein
VQLPILMRLRYQKGRAYVAGNFSPGSDPSACRGSLTVTIIVLVTDTILAAVTGLAVKIYERGRTIAISDDD